MNINYRLNYKRLKTALIKHACFQTQKTYFSEEIWNEYIEIDAPELPVDLYLDESINLGELEDNNSELDGTIWFISLLTRVDGLVLMTPGLEVKGFGVEITFSEEPRDLFIAKNRNATANMLSKGDYNHYGTRHRSMMRYCAQTPDSIGFVVSQDGDLRVMTQVDGYLVMWENIKLQLPDFVSRRRRITK